MEHWDINNELLHGQVYEEITGDRHYSEKIYDMVHAADPVPKLFLNDYDVLAVGSNTDVSLCDHKITCSSNINILSITPYINLFSTTERYFSMNCK